MNESKQIVVTGISSDLGGVFAKTFARNKGVKIVGTMRRAKSRLDKFPSNVQIIDNCDLAKESCCERLASSVGKNFKGPFGLVHCVGDFWDHVPFLDFGPKKAALMFESHINTFYNVMQSLIPLMQKGGGGSCVAFSCNSVRYNYPWMASFTASKSALDSLVRSLSHEFSGDGIRLNSLVLASVKTPKVRASKPKGDYLHFIPPSDIVPILEFLLSKESYLISGSSLNLFRYSRKFYETGYFQRIAKK